MIVVNFTLTRKCNLSCLHCCMSSHPGWKNPDRLQITDLFDRVLRLCSVLRETFSEDVELVFFGGEPLLLGVSFVKKLMEKAFNSGIFKNVRIITNLLHFHDVVCLVKEFPELSVSTSFDPVIRFKKNQQKRKWLENFKKLCEISDRVCVDFTLTKYLTDFPLVDFVLENQIRRFSIGLLSYSGRAVKHWEKLYVPLNEASEFLIEIVRSLPDEYTELIRQNVCLSGMKCSTSCVDVLTVDVNGDVLAGNACLPDGLLGNLFLDSYENIIFSEKRLKYLAVLDSRCSNCLFWSICRGGCLSVRYFLESTGQKSLERPDECPGLKKFLNYILAGRL